VAVGRGTDARALSRALPDLAQLAGRLLRDPRVPRRSKLALGALALYLASPIDLVPDFIPVAGQLDDVLLAAVVLRGIVRSAGAEVVAEHAPASLSRLVRGARAAGRAAPRNAPRTRPTPDRAP
jgi:uncharacterized membrane protein YkvA (DUF1232 family)